MQFVALHSHNLGCIKPRQDGGGHGQQTNQPAPLPIIFQSNVEAFEVAHVIIKPWQYDNNGIDLFFVRKSISYYDDLFS